jgi:hypothetical protein
MQRTKNTNNTKKQNKEQHKGTMQWTTQNNYIYFD